MAGRAASSPPHFPHPPPYSHHPTPSFTAKNTLKSGSFQKKFASSPGGFVSGICLNCRNYFLGRRQFRPVTAAARTRLRWRRRPWLPARTAHAPRHRAGARRVFRHAGGRVVVLKVGQVADLTLPATLQHNRSKWPKSAGFSEKKKSKFGFGFGFYYGYHVKVDWLG